MSALQAPTLTTWPSVLTLRRDSLAGLLDNPATQTLLVGSSKDPNAKITVLLIPDSADRPALAVKVPTTAAAEDAVNHELRILMGLHRVLPAAARRAIPRVVARLELDGRLALVTSALPGVSGSVLYHGWRHTKNPTTVARDFDRAGAWLAAFQAASAGSRSPIDLDRGGVDRLRVRFAGDPALDAALAGLSQVHARLGQSAAPRSAVHGDFWFGNLLIDGDAITGVLDWEAGALDGEPLRDVVRFALTYALYLDRHTAPGRLVAGHPGLRAGAWGAGIVYAIDGRGWLPDIVRAFLGDELGRLGVDPARWRDAALAGIAEIAATADHPEFARLHFRLLQQLLAAGGRT